MSVEFRLLTEEDAPLLVEATSSETGRALWDRTPVGPYSLSDAPDSAELAYWVRPEARGRGLATAALTRLTTLAHERGFTRLWLEIRPDNTASRRVAERAGFVHTHRGTDDYLIWAHQAASA